MLKVTAKIIAVAKSESAKIGHNAPEKGITCLGQFCGYPAIA